MEFQHPWYLALLFLIPLLIGWYITSGHMKEATYRISSSSFISKEIHQAGTRRNFLLKFLYFSVLVLLIIGLARPRRVDQFQETKVNVIDMLLVLDISSSMLADDFPPNRLEAVKKTASEFISGREQDRIGILVFAGESFIQCPLTVDKEVLRNLVNEITVASKEYDGTAIGMAIANGTNRLKNTDVESRVMILLSDGSNNAGQIDPKTAAELAAEYKIKIYTIGAGTNQSFTQIPGRGLIRNEIDEESLKEIAGITGGKYFRATNVGALNTIYKEIDQLERSEIEVREYTRYKDLYGWFLIPAFLIGFVMENTRRYIGRIPA